MVPPVMIFRVVTDALGPLSARTGSSVKTTHVDMNDIENRL
jgi:hypothetical protein